ncbi:predicted protein [Sclerotinia sclerotiorum 1980 UF-70]|uniref:Uncharacterized protein n=1 Tax=Sclerotinia sclerotiorum (strain ATCC 18683 / 1980 / Ss-1) TaxID=665079 RepID=A7F9N8_SCLS1|nr:predicted protein [Sclerotinia sclerotiorum 1980 UF-70]EDO00449.1 predicted protein [Sclerotinia sclerotiorum 1980 UF-70]
MTYGYAGVVAITLQWMLNSIPFDLLYQSKELKIDRIKDCAFNSNQKSIPTEYSNIMAHTLFITDRFQEIRISADMGRYGTWFGLLEAGLYLRTVLSVQFKRKQDNSVECKTIMAHTC